MVPYFGASLYDGPAAYARAAINHIKNAYTPALIVVGERDGEYPGPQSFEDWHALETLGVRATQVMYANRGHHIANRADEEDIMRRTLDWFGKYLSARELSRTAPVRRVRPAGNVSAAA
jgi:dipeptidyl aminopeptidase/acylaminoacyl peptidase